MNEDHEFEIVYSEQDRKDSKHWIAGTVTWGELASWLDSPADQKETAGGYVLGSLRASPCDCKRCKGKKQQLLRNKDTLIRRSGITLDVDRPKPDFAATIELLLPWAAIMHTTFSSTPESPRYRVILPTDRPMTPEEYEAVVWVLMNRLGLEQFDQGSMQPERYMFRPAAPSPELFEKWVIEGDKVPVDDLLREANFFDSPEPKASRRKQNPYEIEGAVGAFNRAYPTLADVVEAFDLPYEHVYDDRWRFIGADSPPGMSQIKGAHEGLYFSQHAHDPAYGEAVSAFDLVRIHKFAELDKDVKPRTPVSKRPSHQAMLDFAVTLEPVRAEMGIGQPEDDFDIDPDLQAEMEERAAVIEAEADADGKWVNRLRVAPRSGKVVENAQNWDLIMTHDPVFKRIYYDVMALGNRFDGDEPLPWRPVEGVGHDKFIGSHDILFLKKYLETTYKFFVTKTAVDDAVHMTARLRPRNLLREYLESLEWDGIERVETSLPGVRPTPYTRMVARKSLVAAVARMMNPGCKWDHTLVLYGDEGLGKSWWIERLARGYSATLGRIDNKDTLVQMRRAWIMVSDEGYSLRKADAESQKEFLTRTHDVFRMPYEREASSYPRHCVIWGTTNDEVFLRRQEGNRRFLIVKCTERVDFRNLTDEYIDQLWAEAVFLYRNGESLILSDEATMLAEEQREEFTEEDASPGIIQAYLDMPVPADWDDMGTDRRLDYISMYQDGRTGGTPGSRYITQVCSAQIWAEALGNGVYGRKPNRADLTPITKILKRMPGWREVGSRYIKPYGTQRVYERIDEPEHPAAADFNTEEVNDR